MSINTILISKHTDTHVFLCLLFSQVFEYGNMTTVKVKDNCPIVLHSIMGYSACTACLLGETYRSLGTGLVCVLQYVDMMLVLLLTVALQNRATHKQLTFSYYIFRDSKEFNITSMSPSLRRVLSCWFYSEGKAGKVSEVSFRELPFDCLCFFK